MFYNLKTRQLLWIVRKKGFYECLRVNLYLLGLQIEPFFNLIFTRYWLFLQFHLNFFLFLCHCILKSSKLFVVVLLLRKFYFDLKTLFDLLVFLEFQFSVTFHKLIDLSILFFHKFFKFFLTLFQYLSHSWIDRLLFQLKFYLRSKIHLWIVFRLLNLCVNVFFVSLRTNFI